MHHYHVLIQFTALPAGNSNSILQFNYFFSEPFIHAAFVVAWDEVQNPAYIYKDYKD